MNAKEKSELLKDAIFQLYVNEGRSISYINRLLKIDRHTLSVFIKENNFIQIDQDKKKIVRFLKTYKEQIIKMIKEGWTRKEICRELKIGALFLDKIFDFDSEIKETKKLSRVNESEFIEIENEIWKPVLGYPNYEVSDYGRVRNQNGLVQPVLNKRHNRFYVGLINSEGKRKNFILARLIAHSFCDGFDDVHNTVNHKDGNTHNNHSSNLEWVSQSQNNTHSYDVLNKIYKGGKPLNFIIEYQNQYTFKTISSFARFVGKSETQTRRWVYEEPEKHCIRKIEKHIVTTIRKE